MIDYLQFCSVFPCVYKTVYFCAASYKVYSETLEPLDQADGVYLLECCCSSSAEVWRACPAFARGAETGRHDDPHLEPRGTQTHQITNLKYKQSESI